MKFCTLVEVTEITEAGEITGVKVIDVSMVNDDHFDRQRAAKKKVSVGLYLHLEGKVGEAVGNTYSIGEPS